ncbi:hypothetical protein NUM3379_12340 [Kineococcus sp. NUM-3379]
MTAPVQAPAAPAAAGAAPHPGSAPGTPATALGRCFGAAAAGFAGHWNSTPLLVRAADRGATGFADLLAPGDVDELLGPRGLRTPFLKLVEDGSTLPRERWTRSARAGDQNLTDLADPDGIARAHAAGATIVLQALHRVWPPLAGFCRDLAAELGHQVQANAYVTPPGAQGFAPHHDTHDVIVLQVDGRKRWTIHPPAVELPLKSQPSSQLGADPAAGRAPVLDTELGPGDALYLPRGWLHSARTTDERSIHLTVGLLATTWADVLGDVLAGAGTGDVALRRALPLPGEALDVVGFRRAVAAWLEGLADEDVLRAVERHRGRAVPAEPVGALAQDAAARTLGPRTLLRPRRGLRVRLVDAAGRTDLVLPDRRVSFPAPVGAAVRAAVELPTSAARLAAAGVGIDEADALVVLRRLLRELVLVPVGEGA